MTKVKKWAMRSASRLIGVPPTSTLNQSRVGEVRLTKARDAADRFEPPSGPICRERIFVLGCLNGRARPTKGLWTCLIATPKGIWTIGVGHTANAGSPRSISDAARQPCCVKRDIFRTFAADLATFEKRVNKAIKVPLAQHEFDALTAFDFKAGGIDRAALVRHLNSGDSAKAAAAFMNSSKSPEIIDRITKEISCSEPAVTAPGAK